MEKSFKDFVPRGIREGKNHSWKSEGHYTKDGKEWTGQQHAHDGQVMTGAKHTADSQNLYHFKELDKEVQKKLLDKMKLKEDLRKWFGKGPKGDWVRVGTDGKIKGDCAREPGEGKPKCMPRSKAHSMSKDDRATSARRKRREDPVADRSGKGGKPVMVKTDVKEAKQKPSAQDRFTSRLNKTHGMDLETKLKYYEDMKKKFQQTSAKAVKSEEKIDEASKVPAGHKFISGHVYKGGDGKNHTHAHYRKGTRMTDPVVVHIDGKEWKTFDRYTKAKQGAINHIKGLKPPSKFRKEDVQISKYEWGRPEGTAYLKAVTPGEPGATTKKNKTTNKYHYKAKVEEHCGCDEENEYDVLEMDHHVFSNEEIVDMENQIDDMEWEDLVGLDIYDEDELEDFESEEEDEDIHDNIDILENLTIQGRMKRRFNARRNKQKLKVARMRASRRAADPARIKRRASRGARNMIKGRLARGRDIKTMPPAERARIETMAKRFSGLVSRLAQRMVPVIRRNELKRLTSTNKKPQKAKKYNPAKAKSQASKQKGKKFKVKKK